MKFIQYNQQHGYSIVEVLVAVAVLMIAIVGPMTIASKGLQNSQLARQQTTAQYLAQEGIELMYYFRDSNALRAIDGQHSGDPWANWVGRVTSQCTDLARGCRVDLVTYPSGNIAACNSTLTGCQMRMESDGSYHSRGVGDTTGTITPFTRQVFATVNGDQVSIVSRVSWVAQGGETKTVSLQALLMNLYDY